MSGTAFNGSPWLTAAEIGGLILFSFGGAAVGATLARRGLQRSLEADFEASKAGIANEATKSTKRRRYAANAEVAVSQEVTIAEELVVPNVVVEDNGTDPTT